MFRLKVIPSAIAIVLVFICCIGSRSNNVAADCPAVTPVPLDEAWLYKAGATGFYPVKSLGTTLEGHTNPKKPVTPLNGSKKSCWLPRPVFSNVEGMTAIPYVCTYESINEQCCELSGKNGMSKMVMGQTKIPEKVKLTIVATDNSTYFALDACADGNTRSWAVLATTKDAKLDDTAIYTALSITEKDVEASKKNAVHPGLTKIAKDPCKMDKILDKMASMNPMNAAPFGEKLKGLFPFKR